MTNGILTPLNIAPGFNKNDTDYSSKAQWVDGDKVRFYSGYPEKIGGWIAINVTSTVSAVPRAIHTWADLQGQKFLVLGHHLGLSLYKSGTEYVDITPTGFVSGLQSNVAAFGFGAGPFGGDYAPVGSVTSVDLNYNESPVSASNALIFDLTQWSLDNFGEDLIATERGGNIHRWRRSEINEPASVIQNSPSKNNLTLVAEPTPYLVTYGTCAVSGAFDPLLIRWADVNDFTDWVTSGGNTAGDYRIQGGSEIVGALKTKRETLVFTDDVVYSQRFKGGPDVFDFDRIADNCGLLSQHGAIDVNSDVFWMGPGSFYIYDGTVRPLETPIDKAVFDKKKTTSINYDQKEKIYVGLNSEFNEIWWFYPSLNSDECDRYVVYNYNEDIWYDGTMDRTTWTNADIFGQPIATDANGVLYFHEHNPKNANGSAMNSWIETGVFDIEDKVTFVNKFVPDFTIGQSAKITFKGQKYPHGPVTTKGPYSIFSTTNKVNFRLRARQLQFTVSCDALDGDFKMGTQRLNMRPDGER
jgi:hypothetical protein